MFGIFMAMAWIIACILLAGKRFTRDTKNWERAKREGSDYYLDSFGNRRKVENDAKFIVKYNQYTGEAYEYYPLTGKTVRVKTESEIKSEPLREASRKWAEETGCRFYLWYNGIYLHNRTMFPINGDVFFDRNTGHYCALIPAGCTLVVYDYNTKQFRDEYIKTTDWDRFNAKHEGKEHESMMHYIKYMREEFSKDRRRFNRLFKSGMEFYLKHIDLNYENARYLPKEDK